jgi:membrane-associated phospholipid phosphatase
MSAREEGQRDEARRSPTALASGLSTTCCLAALVLTAIGLIEFDVPLTLYVRSLNYFQIEYLQNPWLRWLSDIGNQLGRGESLLCVSALLLLAGYAWKLQTWKLAGWETLLAHALAGVLSNSLKHLVGRARPKFMHAGPSEFFPLAGNGWDSFPSGHAMSSFAIATVLATRFPKVRWGMIVLASAISVSRLFRASHYLTDILGGVVLGVLIGSVAVHPWKQWRSSVASGLFAVTPPMAALLAVMTTIGHPPLEDWTQTQTVLRESGFCIAVLAAIIYLVMGVRPAALPGYLIKPIILILVGIGLGLFSGSLLVTAVILLVCLAYWLRVHPMGRGPGSVSHSTGAREAALGLAALLMLYTMIELRVALPMG